MGKKKGGVKCSMETKQGNISTMGFCDFYSDKLRLNSDYYQWSVVVWCRLFLFGDYSSSLQQHESIFLLVISEERGLSLDKIRPELFGTAKKVTITRDDTIILHGGGDKKLIEERCEELLDPIEDEKLCVFLLEKALSKLPAGQHKILGIFDLRGFGTQNADLKFLTFLFDVFYYYYPSRLDEVLFVDAPFIFQPIWQFTKPLVKQYASLVKQYASLVKFCAAETVRNEYFTEETLPSDFKS